MKVSFYNEANDKWYFNMEVKVVDSITIYDSFVASVEFVNDGSYMDIYRSPEGNLIGKMYEEC